MTDTLLKGLHIVITRPAEQALSLCETIQRHGGNTFLFPLISIEPLHDYKKFDEAIKALEYADWAIFISTNSVDQALPRIIKRFGNVPENIKFAAIGHQTAKKLGMYGVHNVLIPHTRFDSETLLALAEMHDVANQNIIIFRGVGGREVLANTLKTRGAHVTFAECYQRVNPQKDCAILEQLWRNLQCHAIVVTSSEAMRYLLKMTNNGNDEWIRNILICVNHSRIAEDANAAGLKVAIATAPDDDAMLACLEHALLNKP